MPRRIEPGSGTSRSVATGGGASRQADGKVLMRPRGRLVAAAPALIQAAGFRTTRSSRRRRSSRCSRGPFRRSTRCRRSCRCPVGVAGLVVRAAVAAARAGAAVGPVLGGTRPPSVRRCRRRPVTEHAWLAVAGQLGVVGGQGDSADAAPPASAHIDDAAAAKRSAGTCAPDTAPTSGAAWRTARTTPRSSRGVPLETPPPQQTRPFWWAAGLQRCQCSAAAR
jgi:hypothetical protein